MFFALNREKVTMQRYFFNLDFPGEQVSDPEGAELADLEAAKCDARAAIRDISVQHIKSGTPLMLRSISICDDVGQTHAKVTTREALDEIIAPVISAPETGHA
jgi:hypothetical protein